MLFRSVLLTFCILVILVVLWLLFASRRFSERLAADPEKAARKKEKKAEKKKSGAFTWVKDAVKEELQEEEKETPDEAVQEEDVAEEVVPEETDEHLDIIEGTPLSTDVDEPLPRIDVRSDLDKYEFPSLELLGDYENKRQSVSQEELMRNNYKIRATLKNYKIEVENVKAIVGPTVTLYKVFPAPGVR